MLIPDEQVAWLRFAGSTNAAAEINKRIEDGRMSREEACIYAAGVVAGMVSLVSSLASLDAARAMLSDEADRVDIEARFLARDRELNS